MKNLLKCRQNKWSEIGKDFFAKMRKNTCILIGFNAYKMRKLWRFESKPDSMAPPSVQSIIYQLDFIESSEPFKPLLEICIYD